VPIAEASKIVVECYLPPLGTPPSTISNSKDGSSLKGGNASEAPVVRVSKSISARWAYANEGGGATFAAEHDESAGAIEEEKGGEQSAVTKEEEVNLEGRVRYEVALAAGESTALDLGYKVTWPADERLVGL
jgi:hypothetical protein